MPQDVVVSPRFACTPRNGNPMVSGHVSKVASTSNSSVAKGVIQVETQEDLAAAGVIHDMPGIFPRVRYDIMRRYTKCIEVGGGHIEHLL